MGYLTNVTFVYSGRLQFLHQEKHKLIYLKSFSLACLNHIPGFCGVNDLKFCQSRFFRCELMSLNTTFGAETNILHRATCTSQTSQHFSKIRKKLSELFIMFILGKFSWKDFPLAI